MSGFDPAWLDLREPADARARSPRLLAAVAAMTAGRDAVTIADLGCGTGSLLRALAPLLPDQQRWILIDGDPAVLAAAPARLSAWADTAEAIDGGVRLKRGRKQIDALFRQIDLAIEPLPISIGEVDLVGASALFDLVSQEWLTRFADSLAAAGAPLYAALSYDGRMSWTPNRPDDTRAEALFNQHQTRDKGTGAALGPNGAAALAQALLERGFTVDTDDSPWLLGPDDAALIRETIGGVASALKDLDATGWPDAWGGHPRAGAVIGHLDVLVQPGGVTAARRA